MISQPKKLEDIEEGGKKRRKREKREEIEEIRRGKREKRRKGRKEEKVTKNIGMVDKNRKWEAKKLSLRFWEVFQIGLGNVFNIDGTIYSIVYSLSDTINNNYFFEN